MRDDRFLQIRLSRELYELAQAKKSNLSRYVRELIRIDLLNSKGKDKTLQTLPPEIRVVTPYTFYSEVGEIINGDTIRIVASLGFYIKATVKVRLNKVDAPPLATKKGKLAKEFVEKELKGCSLVVETRKRDKFDRYVSFVYYHPTHKKFIDIIRDGKLLNYEIVKAGFAKQVKR